MGIVLKRRDNAPIVKIVCGGIVQSILNEKSISKAIEFTKKVLSDFLAYLEIITPPKTLLRL